MCDSPYKLLLRELQNFVCEELTQPSCLSLLCNIASWQSFPPRPPVLLEAICRNLWWSPATRLSPPLLSAAAQTELTVAHLSWGPTHSHICSWSPDHSLCKVQQEESGGAEALGTTLNQWQGWVWGGGRLWVSAAAYAPSVDDSGRLSRLFWEI